ncbi:MAG: hypothetical protein K0R46_2617 [Herbinix sp.]|nr:hypothetical protein [Herbinix sp.]
MNPQLIRVGALVLTGRAGTLMISYDASELYYKEEKIVIKNHDGRKETVYRVGLWTKELALEQRVRINISYELS